MILITQQAWGGLRIRWGLRSAWRQLREIGELIEHERGNIDIAELMLRDPPTSGSNMAEQRDALEFWRYELVQNIDRAQRARAELLSLEAERARLPSILPSFARVSGPPGARIARLLRWIYSAKTFSTVFAPTIADMQHEYFEALRERHQLQAEWIRVRAVLDIAQSVVMQFPVSFAKMVWSAWSNLT
jgi:hypothetical protein